MTRKMRAGRRLRASGSKSVIDRFFPWLRARPAAHPLTKLHDSPYGRVYPTTLYNTASGTGPVHYGWQYEKICVPIHSLLSWCGLAGIHRLVLALGHPGAVAAHSASPSGGSRGQATCDPACYLHTTFYETCVKQPPATESSSQRVVHGLTGRSCLSRTASWFTSAFKRWTDPPGAMNDQCDCIFSPA